MVLLNTIQRKNTFSFFHHLWQQKPQFGALFLLLCLLIGSNTAQAQEQYDNTVTLSQKPTGGTAQSGIYVGLHTDSEYSTYTRLGNTSASPAVPTPNLGTYDLNGTSALLLTDAVIAYGNTKKGTATSARVLYRVYLTSSPTIPAFSQLSLPTTGNDNSSNITYSTTSAGVNLLNGLTSGGNYTIDIRFQLTSSNGTTITDPDGTYSLAFYITPPLVTPPGGTTTWQSTTDGPTLGSTDWTYAANWSNGVPSATSNAVIPAKNNANQVYPILNDPDYRYEVQNLNLLGSGATAAQLTIEVATLRVYGDLTQRGGGLSGATTGRVGALSNTQNSTLIFAGADQLITGQLLVSDIIVAGSGTKSVINTVNPINIISLIPTSVTDGVRIQSAAYDISGNIVTSYSFDTSGTSYVDLGATAIVSTVPDQGETETSYIRGVLQSSRVVTTGVQQNFGNIGLDITANHTPGTLIIYRVVGEALQGPALKTVPTKRRFRIQGDDNSGSNVTASSNIDVVFHYLPSVDELNGIKEENLAMFSTITNGAPYTALGGTVDQTSHTLFRAAIPSLPKITLTLGDKTNPLPVSLSAFTATRSNQNAVLNWTTASELNNTGFEVQVSTTGNNFRKVTFVASKSPNSNQTINYSYTDTETGKAGIRYYRLRQIDTDGTEAFSPVRALNFDGIASASAALAAYPNPFNDKLDFNLDATTVGTGLVRVQVIDMAGRTVREQNIAVANASLTLDGLDSLRSGLYLAKVTLPNGSMQTVRIQKQ